MQARFRSPGQHGEPRAKLRSSPRARRPSRWPSTRVLVRSEGTTSRHSRLRRRAERLAMTVQGCSDYAHGLERDGRIAMVDGKYRATKKGIEFRHDRLVDLRSFVERARREM